MNAITRTGALLAVVLTVTACSSGQRSPRAPQGSPCRPSSLMGGTLSGAGGTAPANGAAAPFVDETQTIPIDLPAALRLAGGQNLDVRGLQELVREAHYEMVHAGQWFFPSIRAGTTFRSDSGAVQNARGDILTVDRDVAFVGADVVLDWEIGEGIFQHLAARQRAGAACADQRATMNNTMLNAAEAYFELLRTQSGLEVAQKSVDLYENYTKEQQAAVDAGRGFQGDLLSARARYAHTRVRRDKAKGYVLIAAARLREVLNLPTSVQLRAIEPQPVPLALVDASQSEQALIQEALAGRPEIRSARMQGEAARAEQNATTQGVLYPDVRVGWRGGSFGSAYDDMDGTSRTAVGLNWKLGRGGIGDSSRQSAMAARTRRARVTTQAVRQMVVREVTSALAQVRAQESAIGAAEQGVADANEALRLYRERSSIGVNQPLEAIVFEGVLTQARFDYVDAVVDYNKAQVRLTRALGRRPSPQG